MDSAEHRPTRDQSGFRYRVPGLHWDDETMKHGAAADGVKERW
jgi:hypothetical protein